MFPEPDIEFLDCGHVVRGGEIGGRCEICGAVCCKSCLKICTECGKSLCPKHWRTDGKNFYCPGCWKKKRIKDGIKSIGKSFWKWTKTGAEEFWGYRKK